MLLSREMTTVQESLNMLQRCKHYHDYLEGTSGRYVRIFSSVLICSVDTFMSNRFLAGISEIFYASLSEKEILSFSKNKKVNPRFSVLFNQLILKGGRRELSATT